MVTLAVLGRLGLIFAVGFSSELGWVQLGPQDVDKRHVVSSSEEREIHFTLDF